MPHSRTPSIEKDLDFDQTEKGNPQPGLRLRHVDASKATKIVEVNNAAFAAATAATKLNPWSRDSLFLYFCCFVAFLCSCANGYDGSLMSAVLDMDYFQKKFDVSTVGKRAALTTSLYNAGSLIGPWFAGPVTDRFGRRGGMFIGASIIVLGTGIISAGHNFSYILAGRVILGFGVSVLTCAAPSYIVEVAPPQWRGRMTAFYNCGWFGGSIPAAGVTLGTKGIKSDMSWRLPFIFQAVPAGVVMLSVWFIPESPRWLIANGKDEEARQFLIRYHGNNDPSSPLVDLEWREFKEAIDIDASDKRWWDYSGLFKTHANRWRFFMVILMGVFGQFSGNGLGYVNFAIFKAVGYGSTARFNLNLANSFLSCFGALIGVALADRMPRRSVLPLGTLIIAFLLAGYAGLAHKWANDERANLPPNLSIGRGSIAFYFIFNFVYSFVYTPLQALYPVECLDTNTRAKGMAMYGVVIGAFGFINTYAGPIALENIQERYAFVFVGWDVIEAIIWYFCCVETVGRSLEQLEEIFEAPNPVAASKLKARVAVEGEGEVALVD